MKGKRKGVFTKRRVSPGSLFVAVVCLIWNYVRIQRRCRRVRPLPLHCKNTKSYNRNTIFSISGIISKVNILVHLN